MTELADGAAEHQHGSSVKRARWFCFEFCLVVLEGSGSAGWSACVSLGHKFEVSRGVCGGRCFQRQQVSMRSQEERSRLKKSSEETLGYMQLLKRWKAVVE